MAKRCSKCKRFLDIGNFNTQKDKPSGYRSACKDCLKKQSKEYRSSDHYKKVLEIYYKSEKYRASLIERSKDKDKKEKNKLFLREYRKTTRSKEYQKEYKKKYHQTVEFKEHRKDRFNNDVQYRLATLLRNRLAAAIRQKHKTGSAVRDLGCSISELERHLESQFTEGMTWGNKGEWHIDHKIPLASFNLSDREQLLIAVHFTNLQPLWAFENQSKGATV
jgi:hypothetical protein